MRSALAVTLPVPRLDSGSSLGRAPAERHSVREFARGMLTLPQVAQLLRAAQGVSQRGGALYPHELYLAAVGERQRHSHV